MSGTVTSERIAPETSDASAAAHHASGTIRSVSPLRSLVTIYDGKLNAMGRSNGRDNPLSSSWFKRAMLPDYAKLRQATMSFFKYTATTPSALNGWTTFKERKPKLQGTRYGRDGNWIPLNAKATNDYIDKRSLAYLANRFSLPVIKAYFEEHGIAVK